MSNISDYRFVLYERLASQKLNEVLSQLNSHNHGSSGGVTIDVATAIAAGTITGGAHAPGHIKSNTVTAANIASLSITAAEILGGTITGTKIANDTIQVGNIDRTSVRISSDGYAVYAP